VPAEHATGYGPRLSALMGEVAGASGTGRRIVQTRPAPVNYIDETPWFLTHTLQWLWVMGVST